MWVEARQMASAAVVNVDELIKYDLLVSCSQSVATITDDDDRLVPTV